MLSIMRGDSALGVIQYTQNALYNVGDEDSATVVYAPKKFDLFACNYAQFIIKGIDSTIWKLGIDQRQSGNR